MPTTPKARPRTRTSPPDRPAPVTLPIDPASVTLDNLRRIDEANRWCLDRFRAWETAKAEAKNLKSEYEDANEALHDLIVKLCGPLPKSPGDEPLPLIDSAAAEGVSDPETSTVTVSSGTSSVTVSGDDFSRLAEAAGAV